MKDNKELKTTNKGERDWTESEISLLKIWKSSNGRGDYERLKDVITPVVIRAYLYRNNNIEEFSKYDINDYNNMVDEINEKLKLNENLLKKIEDVNFLEFIKYELSKLELEENLKPINTEYYQIIEEYIRRLSRENLKQLTKEEKITISSRNMTNTINQFVKELNINDNCIELGSGAGCILRRLDNNNIKGIEINKNLSDISRLLNLISGKEHIEIILGDALDISEEDKYGLTIVEPQNNKTIEKDKYKDNYDVTKLPKNINISTLLLEKAINITKDGGYIVGAINDSILYTESQIRIRKLILDKTIIKAIVSLPGHIQKPFSAINMSIIIMKKKSTNLEKNENFYVKEINKLEEINMSCKEFSKFLKNYSEVTNILNYKTLYEIRNWCPNYLIMFDNLNSSNRYNLNKLCQINTKTLKNITNPEEIYPYIEIKNIDNDNKILKNIGKITYNEAIKKNKTNLIAYPGDIVISTVRSDNAALAIVPNTNEVYIVSNTLAVLTPKNINSELLYFMLSSKKVIQELGALAKGYAVANINIKELKEYKLPITDIPYEKEKEAKELYERINSIQENYKSLNQIIEEKLKVVERIETTQYKINEIINYKSSIIKNHDCEINQVKVSNLDIENLYAKDSQKEIVNKKNGRHNFIKSKDILIPRELNLLQRTSVASETVDGCISNYSIYIFSVNSKALPEYITMLLRTKDIYEELKSNINQKEKENKINKEKVKDKDKNKILLIRRVDIEKLTIKLPEIEIQKKLVEEVIKKSKELSLKDINLERQNFVNECI